MIIIISSTRKRALDWAMEGRLPRLAYYIVTCAEDCKYLHGVRLTLPNTVARVGDRPNDWEYIDSFIDSITR